MTDTASQIGAAVADALLKWRSRGKPQDEPIDSSGIWTPIHYYALYRCGPEGRDAYYRSRHWQTMSSEQKRLEPACAECGNAGLDGTRLEAHHRDDDYSTLGQERPGIDLQTLCWLCHKLTNPKSGARATLEAMEEEQRSWQRWFDSLTLRNNEPTGKRRSRLMPERCEAMRSSALASSAPDLDPHPER